MTVRRLSTAQMDFEAKFAALQWSAQADASIDATVAAIVADVRQRGDAAVLEYTARFDGVNAASLSALELSLHRLAKATFRRSCRRAACAEMSVK